MYTKRIPANFRSEPLEIEGPFRAYEIEEDQSGFAEYWHTLKRHWRLILAFFLIAEVVTVIAVEVSTPLYTATSTILIERQQPRLLERDSNDNSPDNRNSFYNTAYQILKSPTLAAHVINTLGLQKNPEFVGKKKPGLLEPVFSLLAAPFRIGRSQAPRTSLANSDTKIDNVNPSLVSHYLSDLTIRPDYETKLVTIAYTSPYPALAAQIANAHVEAYIQEGYHLRSQSNESAQRFLIGQLGKLEKRLEASERALNEYRSKRGIVDLSATDTDGKDRLLAERMTVLNRALVTAEGKRIALEADVKTINNKNYAALPEVVNNQLIQALRIQISKVRAEYAHMSSEYTPAYPPLAQLRAQLQEMQLRENAEIDHVVDSIRSQYLTALDAEQTLRKQLDSEKAHAILLNSESLREAILAREVATNRALYRSVLARIKVLGVATEAQVSNVSVIDRAVAPQFPSSPKKKLSTVLSGFLSLMLGVAAAFILENRYNGLKTADDVQGYLRLPNLATVSLFQESNHRPAGVSRLLRLLPASRTAPRLSHDQRPLLPALIGPTNEAYRAIRTSILLSRSEHPPRTIVFTSATAGEGKTATAINTAMTFASMLDHVLLIDADLRRPSCHDILRCNEGAGLTEVLSGLCELEDAIQATGTKGLFLLRAGLTAPDPSELLGSSKMARILDFAASRYEYVIVDSAPILPVSDSVVLSTQVDGVVMVASCTTARPLVRDACSRLLNVGAKILGVVLNKADPDSSPYYPAHYLTSCEN